MEILVEMLLQIPHMVVVVPRIVVEAVVVLVVLELMVLHLRLTEKEVMDNHSQISHIH